MSQSKPLGGAKAKAKAQPAKKAAGKQKSPSTVETLRIIEAQANSLEPSIPLLPAEKEMSDRVSALASEIEQALKASDRTPVLHPAAVQAMLAAMSRIYSMHVENGEVYDAYSHSNPVTPTDVMVTASGMLKAANLAVFELGMWQSWTGR